MKLKVNTYDEIYLSRWHKTPKNMYAFIENPNQKQTPTPRNPLQRREIDNGP
ncbi:hypothetical protein SYK_26850 [Pseudodesulfovibrio nedwellii]|uniref:Uncharacterized protein n=1 Tax=Pseudodesulfovibrio nedwellii TaxID=2973072 RepID=A0ABM8B3W6_9BACT|nr:hypothetical protein SYK_26850 [Pseudodesulfovibrio nedwellii]